MTVGHLPQYYEYFWCFVGVFLEFRLFFKDFIDFLLEFINFVVLY